MNVFVFWLPRLLLLLKIHVINGSTDGLDSYQLVLT